MVPLVAMAAVLVVVVVLAVACDAVDDSQAVPEDTRFFFPAECANTTDRTCCPSFGGEQCGGTERGSCQLALQGEYAHCNSDDPLSIFWFSQYFDSACSCNGNYYGAGCEMCAPGWTGDDCETAMPLRVRRDIDTLDDDERARYVRGVHLLATTDHPYWPGKVTIWGWLNAMHVWAKDPVNNTIGSSPVATQSAVLHTIDYAHQGPGMLTWHRIYQWHFEHYMQMVLEDDFYTVPYWNWTKSTAGDITTDVALRLMGGDGDASSLWPWNCSTYNADAQLQCNCTQTNGPFANFTTRTYWGRELRLLRYYDLEMQDARLDVVPLQRAFGCQVGDSGLNIPFNIALLNEAIDDLTWHYMSNAIQFVHSVAHVWVGWTMKLGGPPSDPFFFLHHSYVDQLMERWVRMTMDQGNFNVHNMLPFNSSTVGHNLDQCVTPMFPLTRHIDWLKPSYALGYTYDTWVDLDPNVTTPFIATGTEAYFRSSSSSSDAASSLSATVASVASQHARAHAAAATPSPAVEDAHVAARRARSHRKLRSRAAPLVPLR